MGIMGIRQVRARSSSFKGQPVASGIPAMCCTTRNAGQTAGLETNVRATFGCTERLSEPGHDDRACVCSFLGGDRVSSGTPIAHEDGAQKDRGEGRGPNRAESLFFCIGKEEWG